ncbi:hypothetical protein V2A60_010120 [Cordyceps javanica]
MSVEDCQRLIAHGLTQEFSVAGDNSGTIVYAHPAPVLTDPRVELWAQSVSQESVTVNMLMPGIKGFLNRLAMYGSGYADDYQGVRYKFVQSQSP